MPASILKPQGPTRGFTPRGTFGTSLQSTRRKEFFHRRRVALIGSAVLAECIASLADMSHHLPANPLLLMAFLRGILPRDRQIIDMFWSLFYPSLADHGLYVRRRFCSFL